LVVAPGLEGTKVHQTKDEEIAEVEDPEGIACLAKEEGGKGREQ